MKMKSAKKSLQNKNKAGEERQVPVVVKTESELEEDPHGVRGDGFNVQIKEEPHSQEISEDGDLSNCPDTKPGTGSDIQEQEHMKEECDSDHVKEELEPWLKEERDSEGEAEEQDEVCTGSRSSLPNI